MNWKYKLKQLKSSAKQRGIECNLSLEQYMQLAEEAGITDPSQIGRSSTSYQMGRIGDVGNYEIGNCRFISKHQNALERSANGKAGLGRTKYTHAGVAAMANKISKRFRVISPSGDIFEGVNLNEFCATKGLTQSAMSRVCLGKIKHHKGWTGEYHAI